MPGVWKACALALAGLSIWAAPVRAAEYIHFDPIEWEAELSFDGARETVGGAPETRETTFEEGFTLFQTGYSVDPRIFNFSLEFNPVFEQGKLSGSQRDEDRDGIFLNYDIGLHALQGALTPVSLDAQGSRRSGRIDGSLGNHTDFENENRYLGVNFKTPVFPSTVSYSERFLDNTFRSGLSSTVSEREDVLRSLRFRGRSSKLNLLVQSDWFDDKVSDRNFRSIRTRSAHTLRWGKGSRLRSDQEYFRRRGFRGYERIEVGESARLQHLGNLYSTWDYRYASLNQDSDNISHTADATLNHELFGNLTSRAGLGVSFRDFDAGAEDDYRSALDFGYRKKVFGDADLSAGLGGGYRLTKREAEGALRETVNESHTVGATRLTTLDQRFIDSASIAVGNAAGTVVFTLGSDYEILPSSGGVTQIRILAGGLINVGDTILVDYLFALQPTADFSTTSLRYRLGIDFGWIEIFHRYSEDGERLLSGNDDSFLRDRRRISTGVKLRWIRSATTATAGFERRFTKSGDFETESDIFSQSVTHTLARNAALSFSANETFLTSDRRKTELFSADLSLRWLPRPRLSVRPFAGAWMRNEEAGDEERFLNAGLEIDWRFRRFRLSLRYTHDRRSGTGAEREEDRLMLTLTRRSR